MPWCHILLSMPFTGLMLFLFLPLPVAAPIYLAISATSMLLYRKILHAMRQPVTTGREGMIGEEALVLSGSGHGSVVRCHGEFWNARSSSALQPGDHVRITSVKGLRLTVSGESAHSTDPDKSEDPARNVRGRRTTAWLLSTIRWKV